MELVERVERGGSALKERSRASRARPKPLANRKMAVGRKMVPWTTHT
jgi:hypothetical protein